MGGEVDISEELLESIQDAVGRNIKLCMRKKVQLEVKGDKLESRILALAPHRAYLLSARVPVRTEQTFSLFDIQAISSSKPNQLTLDYDKGQLSLKLNSNEEVDEVVAQIGTGIQEHCPGLSPARVMKKLSLKPVERMSNLQTQWDNNASTDIGPCGAFSRMYWCVCDQLGLPFREEVQWDVDTIYLSQDTRELNLQDFIHLENRDLLAIVAVLEYNQWFTKLSLKDYKLSTDLCDQILRVVARSSRLEELVLENAGLKVDFAQKLASALSQNTHTALHTLNLANNSLEDKGITVLSSPLGKIPSGLKVLNLSKNSLSAKGVNILAQSLCSNPYTITHLDLSGNTLRGDDLPSLWNFLGQPNKLQTLDLSNSDCSLDLVCSSLLRGSLKHLTVLNMSKSVFNLKKGKEIPSSFKEFFSSAQALNIIILSGTKLPLEALKSLLLGLASNPNLKDVSLDLSSCELRSAGSQILEGCIAEIPNISSLNISDNGLDSDLTTLLGWLAKNRSIRHLSLGKNFNNIKSKNLGQVLSSLVHMFQEEESPLVSLSLADSKLKADLSIVLNAVGGNSSLTHLDISGNSMGDIGAKMLAKALQINTKLRTVIWDRNNVSAQGLQDVAAALEKNYTVRFMPVPIMDAAVALKSNQEKTEDALMKMEQYLLRNHETRRYLQEQAYRLQQGIVTSTTQQMIGRLCVKVQDHLNSLRFSERLNIQEDMRAAERLVQDARNSKKLLSSMYHLHSSSRGGGVVGGAGGGGGQSPWMGPIQDKLQLMAGELSTVIDQQLQSLLVCMVDAAESVCPHVLRQASLRPALMRAGEGRMSVSQAFVTSTLLGQSGIDIINKISEVKLSMASFLSDCIIDEILESLSRTQHTLAEHLIRQGQPLLHHDSEETEVLEEAQLQPESLPPPPTELLLTPTSKRKSILFRMVRPISVAFELEFDLDKALEQVPIHMEDLPLPPPPTPLNEELRRQESVCFNDLPEPENPKLEHITKQRPRRKKTSRPFRMPAMKSVLAVDPSQYELVVKLDEGVDDFYAKKVTKIRDVRMSVKDSLQEGEKKRESRMSGFFNLIRSRSSTRTPPTSPHTPVPGAAMVPAVTIVGTTATTPAPPTAASVDESTKTGVKSSAPEPITAQLFVKVEPCQPVDVAVTSEPKGQEEGKKHEAPHTARVRGMQVMSNDFLVQLRAKQEKMKEKAEFSPSKGRAELSHGEGAAESSVQRGRHAEPASKAHFPHAQPKFVAPGPPPAPISQPAPVSPPPPAPAAPDPVATTDWPSSISESTPSSHPYGSPSGDHPQDPPLPLSRTPSSTSSSMSNDILGASCTGSSPKLPVVGPGHREVPYETHMKDQSLFIHSTGDIDTPHLVLADVVEDSVFESESVASHKPAAAQRCTSLQFSTNPAEEQDDRQRVMSLPIPAGLPTPPGSPLGLDHSTAVSHSPDAHPQHVAQHTSPTPAHTEPTPSYTSPTPAHTELTNQNDTDE